MLVNKGSCRMMWGVVCIAGGSGGGLYLVHSRVREGDGREEEERKKGRGEIEYGDRRGSRVRVTLEETEGLEGKEEAEWDMVGPVSQWTAVL